MLMKLLLIACITSLCYGKSITARQLAMQKFQFSDIFPRNGFSQSGFGGTWISGTEITMMSGGNLIRQNVDTKENTTILSSDYIVAQGWSSSTTYRLSADNSKILVRYDNRPIFRHSTVSRFSVVNLPPTSDPIKITEDELQTAFFSANGNLAFVRNNNLYYTDLTTPILPITIADDGEPGIIYNGIPDWVYEEEVLGSDAASWFSQDGNYLAFIKFNDSLVHEAAYDLYGEGKQQYPEAVYLKYPKAGTTNPTVTLKLYNFTTSLRDLEAPVGKVTQDHILGTVFWINNLSLGSIWLNRRQNRAVFVSYNAPSFAINEIMEINEPKGWIDVNAPKCNSNSVCYFISNYENWPTLTSVDTTTNRVEHHSTDMNVLSIYGIDSKGVVYFLSTPAANESFNRHLYSTADGCLTCNLKTPENNLCTYVSATFSKDFSRYSVTCSGPDPITSKVFESEGHTEIIDWEKNSALRERLALYEQVKKRIFHVPVQGGFNAAVMMMIPSFLDWDTVYTKNYPMLVRVYGGPGSVRIANTFGIGYQTYQVSSKEIIYVEIDGRGTGQKGTDMMFSVNNRLGTFEMEDQISVTKYLIESFSFIDPKRVGIWGWSYGGYATAMTLAKDTGKVFACGVSVAPVTNWKFYDSIYTERYMGIDSNATNYVMSDVATEEHVKVIGQHQFFLIHGNADDNVHYQQSMVLARALEVNDILFEQLSYPNEAHAISGATMHLYHSLDRFWDKCFKP